MAIAATVEVATSHVAACTLGPRSSWAMGRQKECTLAALWAGGAWYTCDMLICHWRALTAVHKTLPVAV
eukprot:4271182-Alexandrium_andersonii.AAC.1